MIKAAIIQARTGSARLPGKVLKEINGKPMIEWLINRVKLSSNIDKVVLAIPDNSEDDVLFGIAKRLNIVCVRGSQQDVLSRYLKAAKETSADVIVRITGDCPLIDSKIIDEMLDYFEKEKCDYLINDVEYGGHPRGFDVDVFSVKILKKIGKLAISDYNKEHITTFMLENPGMFKIEYYEVPEGLYRPNYRLCVDEESDLLLVKKIFDYFKPREDFTAREIISYLDNNPKTAEINKNVRQENN